MIIVSKGVLGLDPITAIEDRYSSPAKLVYSNLLLEYYWALRIKWSNTYEVEEYRQEKNRFAILPDGVHSHK